MELSYNIAGNIIKVIGQDKEMNLGDGPLANFRCENRIYDRKLEFCIVDVLSKPKGICVYKDSCIQIFDDEGEVTRYMGSVESGLDGAYIRIKRQNNVSQIEVKSEYIPYQITSKVVLNSLEAEHFVIQQDGIIFHASFIEHDGKAILFTAPSGTGKSTQAELWKEYRNADIVNGDRAVIRLIDGKAYACGIPFAGSSKYCKNATLPLAAIVYLKQSPSTTIKKLNTAVAFKKVWGECTVNTWNSEDVEKATSIVLDIVGQIPVYKLACTPDESAIIALENELKKL